MSIFNQAVCIKDVKDLVVIREHMLDDGGSKLNCISFTRTALIYAVRIVGSEHASFQLEQLDEIRDTHLSYSKKRLIKGIMQTELGMP